jgi:YD repeat-containing protein
MTKRLTGVGAVVICSLASVSFGGSSGRKADAASTTLTTTPGGGLGRKLSCSFNEVTNQLACTMTLSSCGNVLFSTNYASRADFVDEVSVIPPRTLLTGQTTSANPCHIGDVTYTYDVQKRLLKYSINGLTYGYSAWDSSGRPTRGTVTGPAAMSESWTYDDAARTAVLVQSNSAGSTRTTYVYDANGNPEKVVVVSGRTVSTSTTSTTGTSQVCK